MIPYSFFKQINNYNASIKFTTEGVDSENRINFLDMTIFLEKNSQLEFINYKKDSVDTVIASFKQSVVSQRYFNSDINTVLHREYVSCSTDDLFDESLSDLREVYAKNSYPKP